MTHKGWHSRGYLPHFDSAETIQFVTFRLFDSLPRAVTEMLTKQPDNLAKTDESLDGGLGACWLKDPTIAALIENALLHFDGDRYRLLAWCIMPNHVHVIVEPHRREQAGSHRSGLEIVYRTPGKRCSPSEWAILAQRLLR
jgi:putative transposase